MNESDYQIFGIVHGSLGAALLALLVLSAWLDRKGEPESFGIGLAIASVIQILQGGFGFALHGHYESRLRQLLFLRSPAIGWWLERKEHIAIGAIALTWCALAAHHASRRSDGELRARFGRAASWAGVGAAICALMTFSIGVTVAAAMMQIMR
ncbi:MAG: hypothetical protein HY898_26600 [Deltaproteobacteria bacterium]|nr:hypothetical protein [Deltaproteobacteria bacterium]